MARFSRRGLTAGEIALAKGVFEDELAYDRLAIVQAPKLGFVAMAPFGRVIYFSHARAPTDFAVVDLLAQGLFIHEMTHLWQARQGVFLAAAKLSALGKRAYQVRLTPGARFADYNIEAQAEIVRYLFLARARDENGPHREALEALWRMRR